MEVSTTLDPLTMTTEALDYEYYGVFNDSTTVEPVSSTTEELPYYMKFNDGNRVSIITYSILMAVSAVGNITVLTYILNRRRALRTGCNYMFMHLAIADLLVTFLMMPLEIGWNITVTWNASDALCRIMSFFRVFGLFLSSFVIVCISLDRCFAILRPMSNVVNVARRGKTMLIIAWSLATICSMPQVVIFHVEAHPKVPWYEQCVEFNTFSNKLHQLIYRVLGMVMMYGLPLVVIVICYACILTEIVRRYQLSPDDSFRRSSLVFLNRAKNRTLKMVIIVFVVFVICWTPYHVMCMWYWIDEKSALAVDHRVQKALFLFACTNSCLNPIVYGWFNFRSGRGSAYKGRTCQQYHHQHALTLSTSTTGPNSRRGSTCSSIYRNNSNQSMLWKNNHRSSHMIRKNSREMESMQLHPSVRNSIQITSNNRNSVQTTNNSSSRDEENHATNNSNHRNPLDMTADNRDSGTVLNSAANK